MAPRVRPSDTKTTIFYSIPIPEDLDALVRARMTAGGFNSKAEYVRAAIRADLEQASQARLEEKLLRALERKDYRDATPEFFADLRRFARDRSARVGGGAKDKG